MKRERRRLEQPVRLARQLVALALFLTDRQQSDPRLLDPVRETGIRRSPSPQTAAGAGAGTPHSHQHRAAPPDDSCVGIVVASAGRSTPGTMPNAACAESTARRCVQRSRAPPPCARATSSAATRTDERGLRRTADAGDSAISMTSGASTTPIPSARQSGMRAQRPLDVGSAADEIDLRHRGGVQRPPLRRQRRTARGHRPWRRRRSESAVSTASYSSSTALTGRAL